jgi:multiple sugar transport system permease protein
VTDVGAARSQSRPLHGRRIRWSQGLPYLLLAPSAVALAVVLFYPIFYVVALSVQNGNLLKGGLENRQFIGLANYIATLSLPAVWNSILVSVVYSVLAVVGSYTIGLGFALLLSAPSFGRGISRALAIAPWAMPPVVTSIVWMWMYDPQFGVINYVLQQVHIIAINVNWLSDPILALPSVILVTVWKNSPLAMMVLLAGLQSIPVELYEAARIDGAGKLAEFRHITQPGLRPVSAVIVLLLSLWTFKEFTYVFILTGGGPGGATETVVLQVYYQAFKFLDFGRASAIGVVVMLILLVFATVYIPLVYRGAENA